MRVAPVSFGKTYKLVRNKDYAKVENAVNNTNKNMQTLTVKSFSSEIVQHSDGAFYLLTDVEADVCKLMRKENKDVNKTEEQSDDILPKLSLYGATIQSQIDRLIDATYMGENIKVKQGLLSIV